MTLNPDPELSSWLRCIGSSDPHRMFVIQDLLRAANGDRMSIEDRQALTRILEELQGKVTPEMLKAFKRNRFKVAQHHVVRVSDEESEDAEG